jgi:hypothetical protein
MPDNIPRKPGGPLDHAPDVIATPEGDNEFAPDQPLKPAADIDAEGLETPRGSEPQAYKRDHP